MVHEPLKKPSNFGGYVDHITFELGLRNGYGYG